MIHLEAGNRIVADTITSQLNSETRYAVDVTAADHNDVLYKVVSEIETKHLLTVSVSLSCFAEVIEQVGPGYLASRYGDLLRPTTERGFSFSLLIDLEALAAAPEARRDEVVRLASCMRRDIEGAPLWVCFGALLRRTPVPRPIYSVHMRPDEPTFVVPAADRVVVIFAMTFQDPTELALATIFVQELEVVRRTEKGLATAPLVSLSQVPPMELQPFGLGLPAAGERAPGQPAPLGYLSLALSVRHLDGDGRLEKAVGMIGSYRSYLYYHIKATKSNMHSRMRARVNGWLQVLNRAVPDKHSAERKTIGGRTFRRAATVASLPGGTPGGRGAAEWATTTQ